MLMQLPPAWSDGFGHGPVLLPNTATRCIPRAFMFRWNASLWSWPRHSWVTGGNKCCSGSEKAQHCERLMLNCLGPWRQVGCQSELSSFTFSWMSTEEWYMKADDLQSVQQDRQCITCAYCIRTCLLIPCIPVHILNSWRSMTQ